MCTRAHIPHAHASYMGPTRACSHTPTHVHTPHTYTMYVHMHDLQTTFEDSQEPALGDPRIAK